MITISKDEYADLLRSAEILEMLKRVIYDTAEPSFIDSDRLVVKREDKDNVLDAMKVLDYQHYRSVVTAKKVQDELFNDK